ncbi:YcgL domain-containing protein [Luminiphilus sp.]|nr:YcgL domain-containing protein [Luminiphilus sp.]MDA8678492.1 YcgL domain-containing protein [Luminiphilus sp.]
MTVPAEMEVDVFKTHRRPHTFLYVPKDLHPEDWPEGLAAIFSEPQKVLTLLLTPDQPLAMQTAAEVMSSLQTQGYFLQMPPPPHEREQSIC